MSSPPKGLHAKGYGTVDSSGGNSDGEGGPSVHGTDYNKNSALHHREPFYDRARRHSFIEEDEDSFQLDTPPTQEEEKDKPVSWMSLPHKRQLAILVAARLSEPLVQSSLRVNYT